MVERLAKARRRAGRLLQHIAHRGVPQVVVARHVAPVLGYAGAIHDLLAVSDALRARLLRHRRAMARVSPSEPGVPRPSKRGRRRSGGTPVA
jgi:hypothetical protein